MGGTLNLIKLCVGTDSVDDLAAWQAVGARRDPLGRPMHVTRMWPRRAEEVLDGGSLYWVMGGLIAVRQRILDLQAVVGEDGVQRCGLVLDPTLVRTESAPRRPFQGWRYLPSTETPRDLAVTRGSETPLPPALSAALAELGVR